MVVTSALYISGVIVAFIFWSIVYIKMDLPREIMPLLYLTCLISWLLYPVILVGVIIIFIYTTFFNFLDKFKKDD